MNSAQIAAANNRDFHISHLTRALSGPRQKAYGVVNFGKCRVGDRLRLLGTSSQHSVKLSGVSEQLVSGGSDGFQQLNNCLGHGGLEVSIA